MRREELVMRLVTQVTCEQKLETDSSLCPTPPNEIYEPTTIPPSPTHQVSSGDSRTYIRSLASSLLPSPSRSVYEEILLEPLKVSYDINIK